MIGGDVERLVLLRDLHRLDRFARRHVENVQQDRLRLTVAVHPLDDLVNATVACNTRSRRMNLPGDRSTNHADDNDTIRLLEPA